MEPAVVAASSLQSDRAHDQCTKVQNTAAVGDDSQQKGQSCERRSSTFASLDIYAGHRLDLWEEDHYRPEEQNK